MSKFYAMKKQLISAIFIFSILLVMANTFAQVIQGTYAIKNVATGMLLRIKDANSKNGTPLVSYTPVSWKCMTWDFKHTEGDTYRLQNLFSGKTFQPKEVAAEGVAMEEQPMLNNSASQQYEFIPAGKNIYLIRLKATELYVTPSDNKGTVNGAIVLAKMNGSKLQQWTIYEQHPDM
jgi:Ricin-type beta-trefoil lectin domain-like